MGLSGAIDDSILKSSSIPEADPSMTDSNWRAEHVGSDLEAVIKRRLLPHKAIDRVKDFLGLHPAEANL
jgi:hypothetical protein